VGNIFTKDIKEEKMIYKNINIEETKFHSHVRKKCIDAIMDRKYCKEIRKLLHKIALEIEKNKLHL
jgi:hypothetical protein